MKYRLSALAIVSIVAFVIHFVWESVQLPLYVEYGALEGPLPITVSAALGDVLYTMVALVVATLLRSTRNPLDGLNSSVYVGYAALGFLIALMVEYKALALHRWAYTAAMPLLFGVGLSPLVQMTVLLPLSVFISRRAIDFLWRKSA